MLGLLYKSTLRFNYKPHELIISYIQSLFISTWKSADKQCQRHIGPGAWITPKQARIPGGFECWFFIARRESKCWGLRLIWDSQDPCHRVAQADMEA